jgi:hypothetical protein
MFCDCAPFRQRQQCPPWQVQQRIEGMTNDDTLNEAISIAKSKPLTIEHAKRLGKLLATAPEAIEYQMADILSMFVKKANEQENGNELIAIIDGTTV